MADNLRFVQFPHPGREHRPDRRGGKMWNPHSRSHARKFMEFDGKWLDRDGSEGEGGLRAWGEWEAESELLCQLEQPFQDSQFPGYLWRPYYIPKDNYHRLHNTDPFIFGDRFLYSNCKQRQMQSLTDLGGGSVIAFGSGRNIRGEAKWVLDTVFVVADSLHYQARDAHRVLAEVAPDAFLTVTARPIDANQEASFTLYTGASETDPQDAMFSFFPAVPAGGETGFPRPPINLPGEYFNAKNWQSPKGVNSERTREELRGLWNALVDQVCEADLVLGTHASLPEKRNQ